MQILYTIGFVAGFTIILLFLCWLIYKLSGENFWNILKWVKYSLFISSIISVLIWIVEIVITQAIDFRDYSFGILIFCLIFDLLSFFIITITKRKFNQNRRLKLEDYWNRMLLYCLINIIVVPAFTVMDVLIFIGIIN